jgi:hypothetical protein
MQKRPIDSVVDVMGIVGLLLALLMLLLWQYNKKEKDDELLFGKMEAVCLDLQGVYEN